MDRKIKSLFLVLFVSVSVSYSEWYAWMGSSSSPIMVPVGSSYDLTIYFNGTLFAHDTGSLLSNDATGGGTYTDYADPNRSYWTAYFKATSSMTESPFVMTGVLYLGTGSEDEISSPPRPDLAPPPIETYDFTGQENEYNEVIPGMIKLEYLDPDTGEWVVIRMMYATGKESPLDDPFTYSWGLVDAVPGIVSWQVAYDYGLNAQVSDGLVSVYGDSATDSGNAYWMLQGESGGFSYPGGTDLIAPIDTPSSFIGSTSPTGGGVTTIYSGGDSSASGLENVGSPTDGMTLDSAVSVAAGMRLAKPDITDAVRDGVAGLGDAIDDLAGAVAGMGSGGDVAGDVAAGLAIDPGTTFDETDFVSADSSFADGGTDPLGGSIDSAVSSILGLGSILLPQFPETIGQVSSIQINIYGYSQTMTFPDFAVPRAVMAWGIHALFWVGVIMIVRRGVA